MPDLQHMKNRLLPLLTTGIFLCCTLPSFSQSRTIRGRVTDSTGKPIAAVSIVVKGMKIGTSTSPDGNFSMVLPPKAKTLLFTSIGYEELQASVTDPMSVILRVAGNTLSDVVVVAYGTQNKKEITSAISTVDEKTIKTQQVVSVTQALQGTAPGVMVVNISGQPGDNPIIRIRGIASVNASADPLIVLDGIVYDGQLNLINPNDVANFSVLKDASATALYGSRAANGVILINTRTGKRSGPAEISVSGVYGVSSRAIPDYPFLNTQQHFEMGWEALRNSFEPDPNAAQLATDNLISAAFNYNPYGPSTPKPVGIDGKLVAGAKLLWNTDWSKELTNPNPRRKDLNLSVSGGNEKSKYYFSGGYLDQDGYSITSNYQRVSARFNYTADVTNWLQLGVKTSIINSNQNYPQQGGNSYNDIVGYALNMSSVFPLYQRDDNGNLLKDANGNLLYDYGGPLPNRTVNVNRPIFQPSNDVATTYLDTRLNNRLLVDLNTYGQVWLSKNLYFRSSFGINRYLLDYLYHDNKDFGFAVNVGGRTSRREDLTTSWTWNNMIDFDKKFGDHHIEAMASYEAYKYAFEDFYAQKIGFAFSGQQQLNNAASPELTTGYSVNSTLLSYLGRVKYDYRGKYFAEFTARRDGSSIFAPGNRYGFFPAAGASWLISEEDFMKAHTSVNLLKLRASYGSVGNNALLDGTGLPIYFPYLNTYTSGYDQLTYPGVYLNQLANREIQWEKQNNANIGIDIELFKKRFTGSLDLFSKSSNHLLFNQPLVPSTGFGVIINNVAKVQNRGVELNLAYGIIRNKNFTWDALFNITWVQNKIQSLLPGQDTLSPTGIYRYVKGKSIFEFYVADWAGVDPQNGLPMWYIDELDANGHPTGKRVTTEIYTKAQSGRKWFGSGIPKYTGGFTQRFTWHGFDANLLFNYSFGSKYYDYNYAGLMGGEQSGYGGQMDVDNLRRWQKPGDKTDVPMLSAAGINAISTSSRFIYSGDYIRLRNVTLGYSFRPGKNQQIIRNIRVYAQADNFFTWDKLKKGSDPESSVNGTQLGSTAFGSSSSNTIVFKTISAGLNIIF